MNGKNNLQLYKRFVISLCILVLVFLIGTIGYIVIEDMSFLEASFMTVITISTVGYETIKQLSTAGTVFTIVLIIAGVGTAAYILVNLADFILSEFLLGRFEQRRMVKMITKLKDHYIICGLGRVGTEIATELTKNNIKFIVIDNAEEPINICRENNWPCIKGDASSDEVLIDAGIKRARGLFAALDTDSENVYVTLSARSLKPSIFIIARAITYETITKLEKAGADRVLSPQIIAGRRMATMAVQPLVYDFLDTMMKAENAEIRLAEIEIKPKSKIENMTIGEASKKYEFGALIISMLKKEEKFSFNKPGAHTKLEPGQKLIVLGTSHQIQTLSDLTSGR